MAEDQTTTDDAPITGKDLTSAFDRLADRLATVVQPQAPRAEDPPEPEREFTRAELDQAVEAGKITREAADAVLERQVEKRVIARVTETVRGEQTAATVQQQIDSYMQRHPELADKTSPAYQKVSKEFRTLVAAGLPQKSLGTELAALKAVFPQDSADLGPGTRQIETSPELGGGAPPPRRSGGPEKEDEPPSALDARQRAHYEEGIRQGRYKGWKEVREELKFAKPPLNRPRAA